MIRQFEITYKDDKDIKKIQVPCLNEQMARIRFDREYGNIYHFLKIREIK